MINEAKKMAVEMMFWTACPVDDDNCFDAIMNASKIDRAFEDKYGVYLHPIYRGVLSTVQIKSALKKRAIKIISFKCDINEDSSRKILMQTILRAV
ncbi:hypothetical protein [Escherichia coli]|uniref:hypothetical protein n=1 Tax=Escherichia coli TaxID=562 RepID=UPI0007750E4B|nr:hypothetical protein [Escherichia coli]KXR86526.1 hypothetical protein AUQ29_03555 [Escherichia coli]OAC03151.1 hypothetical protein EC13107_189c00190 [Escherichia coli]OAC29564.1 hypothetical protein EC3234A_208c00140 [Escherichia coli]